MTKYLAAILAASAFLVACGPPALPEAPGAPDVKPPEVTTPEAPAVPEAPAPEVPAAPTP